ARTALPPAWAWQPNRSWPRPERRRGRFHPFFRRAAPRLSWESHMSRKIFCALLAACALHVGAHAQPAPESLNFGIISTESSNNLKSAWGPVIEDLSKALGMPVQPFFASDYAGIIEAMRFNKVQVGWFGNKSAIEAVDRAQGEGEVGRASCRGV